MSRLPVALPVFLAGLLGSSWASAQPRDVAGAEKLYDEATRLQDAGDWSGACQRFEQSFALDPAPGTQLNLAQCAEHEGKLALAWSRLKEARSLNADTPSEARRAEIERFIDAAIARIEPRVPLLTVQVEPALPGLRVARDGQPTIAGAQLPVDPGRHELSAEAPGHLPARRTVEIAEGARLEVSLSLAPAPAGAPAAAGDDARPPPSGAGGARSSGLSSLQVTGLVVGGLGVASLGVSLVTGLLASGKESDLDALGCREAGDALACPADVEGEARDLSEGGATLAGVSTATTFAGAALAGTGLVLFLVGDGAPSEDASVRLRSHASPLGGGVDLSGSF